VRFGSRSSSGVRPVGEPVQFRSSPVREPVPFGTPSSSGLRALTSGVRAHLGGLRAARTRFDSAQSLKTSERGHGGDRTLVPARVLSLGRSCWVGCLGACERSGERSRRVIGIDSGTHRRAVRFHSHHCASRRLNGRAGAPALGLAARDAHAVGDHSEVAAPDGAALRECPPTVWSVRSLCVLPHSSSNSVLNQSSCVLHGLHGAWRGRAAGRAGWRGQAVVDGRPPPVMTRGHGGGS
jgi:hypothetical protein